jgi:UDPglucose 6-dehydrogenase
VKNITYVGGAGRLGYPLALWSSQWYNATIADINKKAVAAINAGEYRTYEPVHEGFDRGRGKPPLATTDIEHSVEDAELVFIIVPTPSKEDGSFSIDFVLEACQEIGKGLAKSELDHVTVVIVSTVNPGDCEGPIKDKLARFSERTVNPPDPRSHWPSLDVVYSPEFVRQGSIMRDFANPDFILLGCATVEAASLVAAYYDSVTETRVPIHTMSLPSAEIAKLGLNCAVTAKMVLANQLAWLCHLTPGSDAIDVLSAIGQDRRIGPAYFSPGPPPGGPCFPRDLRALGRACQIRDADASLPMATDYARNWQLSAITWHIGAYGARFGVKNFLILGTTYKPGVNIVEEATGLHIAVAFEEAGFPHRVHDPSTSDQDDLMEKLKWGDMIVIATNWPEYKVLEKLDLTGKVIFDLWGMLAEEKLTCDKYIRLGRHEPIKIDLFTGRAS